MMRVAWLLLALSGVARADLSVSSPRKEGSAALKLLAPWRDCAALKDTIPFDAEFPNVEAKLTDEGAEAVMWSSGSGRDAYCTLTTLRLVNGRCDARGWETSGPKEWDDSALRSVAKGGAKPPTVGQIAAWWSSMPVVDDVDRDDLAAARVLMQLWDEAHVWRAQPEHAGRPRGSPAAIWTADMLHAAGVAHPQLTEEDGTRDDGVYHGRLFDPSLLVAKDNLEIWQLRWHARNGGGLIAVYDRARDRHRWLWATHRDWLDDESFVVERFADGKLILRTKPDIGTIVRVAIDVHTGAVETLP